MKLFAQILLLAIISHNSAAADKFRVCADPLHPPYSSKQQDGFENKIASLFAKSLGQELEYYWFPQRIGFIRNTLKAQITGSEQYKCDVVMGLPSGYDFAKTTKPYYRSNYVLVIAKGRGFDDITQPRQLADLSLRKQESLQIAMFDRGPGTAWLQNQGLLEIGIPYQTMNGDKQNNIAMQIAKDLQVGKINMVIIWGPMAGHIVGQNPANYTVLNMRSTAQIKFDFPIAMGVRYGDNKRKDLLNRLIDQHQAQIQTIISQYHIPLLPITSKND